MTGILANEAQWCRNNLGKLIGEIPPRPADNRCELCKKFWKERLQPEYDPMLKKLGLSQDRSFRGWLCGRCRKLLSWIWRVGEEKVFEYMGRGPLCAYPTPPRPPDGRCELCGRFTRSLHRDHDHFLDGRGYSFEDKMRGHPCGPCNMSEIAWIDEIGVFPLKEYLGRARRQYEFTISDGR